MHKVGQTSMWDPARLDRRRDRRRSNDIVIDIVHEIFLSLDQRECYVFEEIRFILVHMQKIFEM